LFGLGPALDSDCQRVSEVVTRTLAERFDAERRGRPSADVTARANGDVEDLCRAGLAEPMLTAYDVALFASNTPSPGGARLGHLQSRSVVPGPGRAVSTGRRPLLRPIRRQATVQHSSREVGRVFEAAQGD